MNSIVKSSIFVFLTALVLPVYAATDTGVNGANNTTATQQEKSAPVKQKAAVRHHYRHHHHHYYHSHHYIGYRHYYGYRHYTCGCNSCRTCAKNMFYHRGCCVNNVFSRGCGCCANRGRCVPNYYY